MTTSGNILLLSVKMSKSVRVFNRVGTVRRDCSFIENFNLVNYTLW